MLTVTKVEAAENFEIVDQMSAAKPHFLTNITENKGSIDKTVGEKGVHVATMTLSLSDDAVYGTHYPIWFGEDTNLSEKGTAESVETVNVQAEDTIGVETLKTYTVTYDANAGTDAVTGMPDPATAKKPHNAKLEDLPQLTRDSYNFLGWATNPDATAEEYTTVLPANVNPANGLTLYAVWKANTHTVTWKNFDGTTDFETTEVTHGEKPYDPGTPTYTKVGYTTTFQGWADSANQTSGTAVDDLPAVTTDGVIYYAAFSAVANSYTIAFAPNEGSGSMDPMNAIYDQEVTLTANTTITRTGYTFNGWNTKKDGSGDDYADGAKVKNLISSAN